MHKVPGPTTEADRLTTSHVWTPKVIETDRGARNAAGPILDPRDPIKIARALVDASFTAHGHRCIHHYRGGFFQWNGSCYRSADDDTIKAKVWTFLEGAQRAGRDGTPQPLRPNKASVSNVIEALQAVSNLPKNVEAPIWLGDGAGRPPAAEILPVSNGLLHLPTGRILPPSPAFFGFNAATLEYDLKAPQPVEFFRFMADLFGDDQEAKDTLQEIMGYSLTPDTSQQKIFLVVGPPRSGKGTIGRLLTEMVGRDNVAAPTLASLSSQFGLAPLIGKPIAIVADARLGSRSDQSAIAERLLSISGEDTHTIDRKFQSSWTGRLATRFLIFTNELPRLADASGALASRFIVLTLQNSFLGNEDPGLTPRLLGELPGILNWAREGYLRLRKRGYFIQPESAREAIADLEALGSPVTAFVRERCTIEAGRETLASALYSEWQAWCLEGGRQAGTAQTFGRDLKAAYPALKVRQSRSTERARAYVGIKLG